MNELDQREPLPRHFESPFYVVEEDAGGLRLTPGRQPRLGCGLVVTAVVSVLGVWAGHAWFPALALPTLIAGAIAAALAIAVLLLAGMAAADRQQAALGPYLTTDLARDAMVLPRRGDSIPFNYLVAVECLVVRQPAGSERMVSTHTQVNLRHRTAQGVARTNLITVEGHQGHEALRQLAGRLAARAQLAVSEDDYTFPDEAAYQAWNRGRWSRSPAAGQA